MGLFGRKKPFFAKFRASDPAVIKAYGGTIDHRMAVFGDVHANLEALEAVLKDAERRGVSRFACTGDLVGYGPNPSECLEIVKELGCPVVKGNHDEYAATDISLKDFTLHAMNALIWTREHLSAAERAWLDELPMEWDLTTAGSADLEATSHLVHSSVYEPEAWRYIIKQEEAEKVLPLQPANLVFFGHTHVPASYAFNPDTGAFKSTVPAREELLELEAGWKWLVNPGSVGQPRDHDPRAAYIIYDSAAQTIEQRRVEYDFRKTAKKIVAAGLPDRNAQRLYKGR